MTTQDETRVYDKVKCFGYYGFGGGYDMARQRNQGSGPPLGNRPTYCNHCSLNAACWNAHRGRVRTLFPELTAYLDTWTETGAAYLMRIQTEFSADGKTVTEPYLNVMMGNMEDGARIANDIPPKDRGNGTLTWPLTPVPAVDS